MQSRDSVTFFKSYLEQRKQKVFLNGKFSSEGVVKYGVPQGSILGPTLFCMFINDLPLHLSHAEVLCEMFADDSTLHTADKELDVIKHRLQISLGEVSLWCKANAMLLNPAKTESMVIATRQKHQLGPLDLNLKCENTNITQVSKHKLLGVIIDKELQWQPHVDKLSKCIAQKLYIY